MNAARAFLLAAKRDAQIDLIFFDAGGGHRASATALKALAEQQRRDWQIRMVNLREILEPIDVFHRITGVRVEDLYNRMLKYGLTIGTGPMLRATQFLIRRMHPRNVALLSRYWKERRPDLVVSVIPNFNRAIFEGLTKPGKDLAPAPDLAESWTTAADGLSWTFKLRSGVKWSDGTAFSADDVAFTFNDVVLKPDLGAQNQIGRAHV